MTNGIKKKKFYKVFLPPLQYATPMARKPIERYVFRIEGVINSWEHITFDIQKNSGLIADFLTSNLGGRLCSQKLKEIIERFKRPSDVIQWLPVNINFLDSGESFTYYHLHFINPFSGYSKEHSMFGPDGSLMSPAWIYEDIKDKEIFTCSGIFQYRLIFISDTITEKIEHEECTGLNFKSTSIVYN